MAETMRQPPAELSPTGHSAKVVGHHELAELITSCNQDGMDCLRMGQLKSAFDQFKYAEGVLQANQTDGASNALWAATCNNLGCYYKKVGKFHGALSYLRRALKLEVELNTDEVTLAGTHLNLCAILSKLEKHDKAVQHALAALELMNKRVSSSSTIVQPDDYAVLAIAYHNVGMERKALNQGDQAASAFQSGYQVAKLFLGDSHPLCITLSKNCDVVLAKGKQAKLKQQSRIKSLEAEAGENPKEQLGLVLPPLALTISKEELEFPPKAHKSQTADWMKQEEAQWELFALKTLRGDQTSSPRLEEGVSALELDMEDRSSRSKELVQRLPPLSAEALLQLQELELLAPKAFDQGTLRFQEVKVQSHQSNKFTKALENHPESLMDILDADGDGQPKTGAPNDYRPNRVIISRSTRTSRVVRRTGVFNSTAHRDRIMNEKVKRVTDVGQNKASVGVQRRAAELIQSVWRAYWRYCQEHSEWLTISWICATMIQANWRGYKARQLRPNLAAATIQRVCRGYLTRKILRKRAAATTIQRTWWGSVVRRRIQLLHKAAIKIQKTVRGGVTRLRYRPMKEFKLAVICTIQRHFRVALAKAMVAERREQQRLALGQKKAAIDLQRTYRGMKGRKIAAERQKEYTKVMARTQAAVKVQSMARAHQAVTRVNNMRYQRMMELEKAATFVRKMWLGMQAKKRYAALRREFEKSESKIITIQRYMRGFIVRTQLWNKAEQHEEQSWAAIEIQRMWRGYAGRVRWENRLELVWRQEMAAAMLQRNLRGWVARVKVGKMRRKIARAEFEKARQRFRAAQQIQAVVRGMKVRYKLHVKLVRAGKAAVAIQRIARGRAVRNKLWRQVLLLKTITIQAAVRGLLVRCRQLHLIEKVVRLQRRYRRWRRRSQDFRREQIERSAHRRAQAKKIQQHFRHYSLKLKVMTIKDHERVQQQSLTEPGS